MPTADPAVAATVIVDVELQAERVGVELRGPVEI
jgi:hypothetical protein